VPILREFYTPFAQAVARAEQTMQKVGVENQPTGEICDQCGHPMVFKYGRFGKFIACSNFPACRNTKPYLEKIGVACPQCGGELAERRSRRGRTFYGCSNYPTCQFVSWKRPLPQPCPACGGLMVVAGKQGAQCTRCGYREAIGGQQPAGNGKNAP
jgi:DNA topoisomerase-1